MFSDRFGITSADDIVVRKARSDAAAPPTSHDAHARTVVEHLQDAIRQPARRAPTELSYREKLALLLDNWDESKHPRDKSGEFVDSDSSGSGSSDYSGRASALAPEERSEVIRRYTESGGRYRDVNGHLRDGREADDGTKLTLAVMDQAFEKEAEPVDRVLYRGMSGFDPEELGLEEGKEFSDPGFVSTTTERGIANRFAAANESGKIDGEDAVGIIFKINGKGTPSVNLSRYSRYGEDERLLPRGTTFKVTNIKKGSPGKKFSVVTMSVVKK